MINCVGTYACKRLQIYLFRASKEGLLPSDNRIILFVELMLLKNTKFLSTVYKSQHMVLPIKLLV